MAAISRTTDLNPLGSLVRVITVAAALCLTATAAIEVPSRPIAADECCVLLGTGGSSKSPIGGSDLGGSGPGIPVLAQTASSIAPPAFWTALSAFAALLLLWPFRERSIRNRRQFLRRLALTGEEAAGCATPLEVARKLMAAIGAPLRISGLGIFVYNRQSQLLDSFHGEGTAREYAGLEPLSNPIAEAAAAVLRTRDPLSVPDSRGSPFFRAGDLRSPRSALFLPMLSQSELAGVLEIECRERARSFSVDEQAVLQHVANQAAAVLRAQEQQALREELLRTEKLAAAGQLMAGIANELRPPLETLVRLGDSLRGKCGAAEPIVAPMIVEARRAAGIVQRLLAFSTPDRREPEAVDLNETIARITGLHRAVPRARNIPLRLRLSKQRPITLGSREQLSQVLLNLISFAEQSLSETRGAAEIGITTVLLARRAIVEISWPARAVEADPGGGVADLNGNGALSLALCRGIMQSHGGELRVCQPGAELRFELDLPALETLAMETKPANTKQRGTRPASALWSVKWWSAN